MLINTISIFIFSCIRTMTPILFGALAALIARKSGIENVGIEGLMMLSALAVVIFSHLSNCVVGGIILTVLAATLMAVGLSLLIQKGSVSPIIAGTAINIFSGGGTIFMLHLYFGTRGYSESVGKIPNIELPFISSLPLIGSTISGHSVLTYLAIFLTFAIQFFYSHSIIGIRFRAVGENSEATLAMGINVFLYKTVSLIISCVIASLGGIYMSMSYMNGFNINMVSGRGFIALAVEEMTFGKPLISMMVSFLFGIFFTISNYLQGSTGSIQLVQSVPYISVFLWLLLCATIRKKGGKSLWKPKKLNKYV